MKTIDPELGCPFCGQPIEARYNRIIHGKLSARLHTLTIKCSGCNKSFIDKVSVVSREYVPPTRNIPTQWHTIRIYGTWNGDRYQYRPDAQQYPPEERTNRAIPVRFRYLRYPDDPTGDSPNEHHMVRMENFKTGEVLTTKNFDLTWHAWFIRMVDEGKMPAYVRLRDQWKAKHEEAKASKVSRVRERNHPVHPPQKLPA